MDDLIVIGSGGAGLAAALTAASCGSKVLALEASSRWGGSTSVSAGEVWVPANHLMPELGIPDSVEDALTYCLPYTSESAIQRVRTFLEAAPLMARLVEEFSPIVWRAMSSPDSFAEAPGGRASGRHLEVSPLMAEHASLLEKKFWMSSYPPIFTNDEVFESRLLIGGKFPQALADRRISAQSICTGVGLVHGLMQGCQDHGVEFERDARVVRLLRSKSARVCGVVVKRGEIEEEVLCNRGVVLATGGFEWNDSMRQNLLDRPVSHPVSPPLHHGDGLRMVQEVGGVISGDQESWEWPVGERPDQRWPDTQRPRHELVIAERCMPHVIWVDESGRRFVNESSHNCALAINRSNPDSLVTENSPVWAIFDQQYRRRYPLAGAMPSTKLAPRIVSAGSLEALGREIGVDGLVLSRTVDRFNEMVGQGRDLDFFRGESAYDRHYGDSDSAHPCLGSIQDPPFFGMPVHLGTVGTKGGALVDERARVLDARGQPLEGLWAAGNTMASVIGPETIAPGLTLGLALTWGYIAGRDAALL